jgi:sulfur-oxidizing protein SoxB
MGSAHKLIPIFSDVIAPDPEMTALIDEQRAPYEAELSEVLGQTESLLYRRGNFNGTWDDLICTRCCRSATPTSRCRPASAGGRPAAGRPITREDLFNATAMTYPRPTAPR